MRLRSSYDWLPKKAVDLLRQLITETYKTPPAQAYLSHLSLSLQQQTNTSILKTTSINLQFTSSRLQSKFYIDCSMILHTDLAPSFKMPSVNEQPMQTVEMTANTNGVETQQPVSLVILTSSWRLNYPHNPKN